jgi:hypothetical protein
MESIAQMPLTTKRVIGAQMPLTTRRVIGAQMPLTTRRVNRFILIVEKLLAVTV